MRATSLRAFCSTPCFCWEPSHLLLSLVWCLMTSALKSRYWIIMLVKTCNMLLSFLGLLPTAACCHVLTVCIVCHKFSCLRLCPLLPVVTFWLYALSVIKDVCQLHQQDTEFGIKPDKIINCCRKVANYGLMHHGMQFAHGCQCHYSHY